MTFTPCDCQACASCPTDDVIHRSDLGLSTSDAAAMDATSAYDYAGQCWTTADHAHFVSNAPADAPLTYCGATLSTCHTVATGLAVAR